MSYRRKKTDVEELRKWQEFLSRQGSLIAEIGLSADVLQSQEHWLDFLDHGYLDHHADRQRFCVDALDESRYRRLVRLIENYFASGFDRFEPTALRPADRTGKD